MGENNRREEGIVCWDIYKTYHQDGEHPMVYIGDSYGLSFHKWKLFNENGRLLGYYICIVELGDNLDEIQENYFSYELENVDTSSIENGNISDGMRIYKQYGGIWKEVVYKKGKWSYKDSKDKTNRLNRMIKQ